MDDCNHFRLECSQCSLTFPDEEAVKNHEIQGHLYCADCDRSFSQYNNIKMVGEWPPFMAA